MRYRHTTTYNADINNDGVTDYLVTLTPAMHSRSAGRHHSAQQPSLAPAITAASDWNTVWDIDATVTNATTGAFIHMHSGVNVLLTEAKKNLACP